jgi:hypothetical protein
MVKQSPVDSLKESIRLLEIRQAEEGEQLREQFKITYESLKPVNLIKNSLKDIVNSSEVKNSLFETVISLVSGYLTQKFIVNSKSNVFVKLLGVLMQFGITNLVSKNTEAIRTFITNLIEKYTTPEEEEIPEPEV